MGNSFKTSRGARSGQMFRDFVNLGVDDSAKKGLMFAPNAKGKDTVILDVLKQAAKKNKTELGKAWGLEVESSDFDKDFIKKLDKVMDRLTVSTLEI